MGASLVSRGNDVLPEAGSLVDDALAVRDDGVDVRRRRRHGVRALFCAASASSGRTRLCVSLEPARHPASLLSLPPLRSNTQKVADFGPKLVNIGPQLVEPSQNLPSSGRCGPNSAESGQIRPKSHPNPIEIGPTLVEIDPTSVNAFRILADFGSIRGPCWVDSRSIWGQSEVRLGSIFARVLGVRAPRTAVSAASQEDRGHPAPAA